MSSWIATFGFPPLSLDGRDSISWDGSDKVTTRIIWDSIRQSRPAVSWHSSVWFPGHVPRFAHHSWLLCHGRLNTLSRLHSFGMNVQTHCYLCAGGIESAQHLLMSCSYAHFILQELFLKGMDIIVVDFGMQWHQFITHLFGHSDLSYQRIALLTAQTFAYHVWRERNARAHNKGIFGPAKLLRSIRVDVKSKLSSSKWFSKAVNCRPDLVALIS